MPPGERLPLANYRVLDYKDMHSLKRQKGYSLFEIRQFIFDALLEFRNDPIYLEFWRAFCEGSSDAKNVSI